MDGLASEGLTWRCKPCNATRRKSLRFDAEVTEGTLTLDFGMPWKRHQIDDSQTKQVAYELLNETLDEHTESVN